MLFSVTDIDNWPHQLENKIPNKWYSIFILSRINIQYLHFTHQLQCEKLVINIISFNVWLLRNGSIFCPAEQPRSFNICSICSMRSAPAFLILNPVNPPLSVAYISSFIHRSVVISTAAAATSSLININ